MALLKKRIMVIHFLKKDNNYYSFFKDLKICLKEMQYLDKILKLNIKELSILNEFITIYNVVENFEKINKLDITIFINILIKSLEIIEKNDENKIDLFCENLKILIEIIKKALYDISKEKEIKGNTVYYELISNIFLNEIKRENNIDYKYYILKEFLLQDEKLFIQSNQILKLILEDFGLTNKDKFQDFLDSLSNPNLKILDNKTNNACIKETLTYLFEQISIIYIENLKNINLEIKYEKRKNIILDLQSFFARCLELLEYVYKDENYLIKNKGQESKPQNKKEEKIKSNIELKKLFCLAFIRVYLKLFIDWIDKNRLKSSEIEEIIKIINGNEINSFREMIRFFIYKILYNMNQQDINKLLDEKVIDKFHLNSYSFKL